MYNVFNLLFQLFSLICAVIVIVFYIKAVVSWMTLKKPKKLSSDEFIRKFELDMDGPNTYEEYSEQLRLEGKETRVWRRPTILLWIFFIIAFIIAVKWGFRYLWSVYQLVFGENGYP